MRRSGRQYGHRSLGWRSVDVCIADARTGPSAVLREGGEGQVKQGLVGQTGKPSEQFLRHSGIPRSWPQRPPRPFLGKPLSVPRNFVLVSGSLPTSHERQTKRGCKIVRIWSIGRTTASCSRSSRLGGPDPKRWPKRCWVDRSIEGRHQG